MRRWFAVAAVVAAVLVVGILLLPQRRNPNDVEKSQDNTIQVPPIRFTDVTDAAGIRFKHTSGATPQKLLPETMGSGVAVIDFDRDGHPDLFFVNSRPWPGQPASRNERATQVMYRNRGDGTFEDFTAGLGLDIELFGQGVAVGDYDNDGWPDLLVTAVGGNRLFRNREGKRFEDSTLVGGLPRPFDWPTLTFEAFLRMDALLSFPASAAFLDYDGDGWLDLFVCNYLTWSPDADFGTKAVLPGGMRAYVPPQQFNGAQSALYRNIGGGRFRDVSAEAGIQVSDILPGTPGPRAVGKSLGVAVCDADNDGWPDIVVANDTVRNFFFHNVADPNGGRRYQENGLFTGLAYADGRPRGGMGIDAAEVLPNDLGIIVANFSNEPCSLFRRLGTKPVLFGDAANEFGLAGASRHPMKFGSIFFDCDRDGRPDLLLANGHLEPDIARAEPGQLHAQQTQLFWNSGHERLLFVPSEARNFAPIVGRGCAYLDFDRDGDLDVVITANNGRARLFRNDSETENRAIRFLLRGNGKSTNRDAIGAAVEVEAGGTVRRTYFSPTRGYLSQSEGEITIGVGTAARIDRVSVRWPGSGLHQDWKGLEPGQSYNLTEGEPEKLRQ